MEPLALLTEPYRVRNYEVSPAGTLSLYHLLGYFQETASNHASKLGWSYQEMLEKGLFWALSRMQLTIHRLPQWGEEVELSTWPKGTEKLFAVRDFLLTDAAGEVLVSASSVWLVVDTASKRPKRASMIMDTIPNLTEKHALRISLAKFPQLADLQFHSQRQAYPSDLDVNQHVNNAKYLSWIEDALLAGRSTPKTLTLQFNSELKLGDQVTLKNSSEEGTHYVYLYKEGTEKPVAQASFSDTLS